jgi:hypothetical protein
MSVRVTHVWVCDVCSRRGDYNDNPSAAAALAYQHGRRCRGPRPLGRETR